MSEKRIAQQEHVGDDEAEGKNLCRGEASKKQHLRKDEGAAPYSHYHKRYEVIEQPIA